MAVATAGQVELIRLAKTELSERHLRHFIPAAWHVVEPATEFKPNWHLDAIADHLEAVEAGEIRNLLVTMPPRMMKSLTISVFYPAWRWIRKPEMRFMYASYSSDLSTAHSVATRRVIESDWYQDQWSDRFAMASDANLKTRFENDRRGQRFSTSVGGVVTGIGGDRIIVDDPHNVREAESEAFRLQVITWWDQAMSTRGNDPKTVARIIVMQRVHELDLAGHVLEQGGYVHLNLPMEYEPKSVHFTGYGKPDPREEEGDLLAPDRVGPVEIADLKLRLGSRGYAGQFQQRPAPAEGALLKRIWWRYYRRDDLKLRSMDWIVQSWDTAFKKDQENDYSVCVTMGLSYSRLYVIDVYRAKLEFPDLKRAVREQFTKHNPDEIIVEDKASGQSLIQELGPDYTPDIYEPGRDLPMPIVKYDPGIRDKVSRAHAASPYLEGGRQFIPAPDEYAWVDPFIEELAVFPGGAHDDQVDAYTQATLRLVDRLDLERTVDPGIILAFDRVPA